MSQPFLANVEAFAAVAATGLAVVLAVVSFLSYQRLRNRRALFIGLAFVGFAAKGVYLILEANRSRGDESWVLWMTVADLAILLMLYFAIRSR